ncbi:MAG: oligopeptidase B, partial [Phycisphaeraceae bacterium]|nr:oligopeptidase B [Phycisphaeraceae bacterium]
LPDTYYGAAWTSDSLHYFYTSTDAAMRPWQVWRHRLGSDRSADVLVCQEDDDRYFLSVWRSRSGGFIFIGAESAITSDVRCIPADDPEAEPSPVLPRSEGVQYAVDHRCDEFWLVTNAAAADGQLLRVPLTGGEPTVVVAHTPGSKLAAPDCFAGHIVVWGRHDGLPAALIVDPDGGPPSYLEFDEPVFDIVPGANYEFETDLLRYGYQSPVTPASVVDHNVTTGARTVLKRTPVLGGYESSDYAAERVWASARDGARIPVSVVRRADTPVDGSA